MYSACCIANRGYRVACGSSICTSEKWAHAAYREMEVMDALAVAPVTLLHSMFPSVGWVMGGTVYSLL